MMNDIDAAVLRLCGNNQKLYDTARQRVIRDDDGKLGVDYDGRLSAKEHVRRCAVALGLPEPVESPELSATEIAAAKQRSAEQVDRALKQDTLNREKNRRLDILERDPEADVAAIDRVIHEMSVALDPAPRAQILSAHQRKMLELESYIARAPDGLSKTSAEMKLQMLRDSKNPAIDQQLEESGFRVSPTQPLTNEERDLLESFNPFQRGSQFNLSRQMRAMRADPQLAARLQAQAEAA
jgi:hypothetical protein